LETVISGYELDIAGCAMIIAAEFQPGLDIQSELGAIDRLVAEAKSFPVVDAHSLVEFLAIEKNFSGNSENYYSVSNSLLNHVLATKRGIPITLALVYLSVVQKLKSEFPPLDTESYDTESYDTEPLDSQPLTAWGINFPGHFLVGVSDSKGEHLIDPFKGCLVTREDCYSIITRLYGRHHEPDDRYFERADSRQLLRRILENLKAINLQKADVRNAMVCLDYQLMLYPEAIDLQKQQDKLLKFLRDEGQSGESRLQ